MAALAVAAVPAAALAAVDAYLYIDGATGDATDAGHRGWIEVGIPQWGVGRGARHGLANGRWADRESSAPSVSEIVVTKANDKASTLLSKCVATGCRFGSAILEMKKPGDRDPLLRYILSNLMLTGYHVTSGGDRPTESLSLHFTKIEKKAASASAASINLNSSKSNMYESTNPSDPVP